MRIYKGLNAKVKMVAPSKTIGVSQTQGKLWFQVLVVQTRKCMGSDALTLLCCNACIRILLVRIYWGLRGRVPSVEFRQTIGPSLTQSR